MNITQSPSWKMLEKHANILKGTKIKDMVEDEKRLDALSLHFDQLFCDFSKQKVQQETIELLLKLAEQNGLKHAIEKLLLGEVVNPTEDRPALHTALRLPKDGALLLNGRDINIDVQNALDSMSDKIDKLTNGYWRGFSGKPITDVVNLGVGGSDLGPLLACDALAEFSAEYQNPLEVHFASTMDGSQVHNLFEKLNPETTVFIIASKSFSTIDTLSNATSAKSWLLQAFDNEEIINKQHFIGISTKPEKMNEWGIHPDNQLIMWDWVGGRFSLWSTVGLTIALKLGMQNFREFLAGAHALDKHFKSAPFDQNIPVLLGIIGIWNTNFIGINAHAILPYDARLKYFPSYLTQLEMESNGKSVTVNGDRVDYDTCPVLWGEVGPNAQHAFYQLLHQGTRRVVCDFIAPVSRFTGDESPQGKSLREQHLLTIANCFAQSRALMTGGSSSLDPNSSNQAPELIPHKFYPGDQPSTTILVPELTPYSLGQLIALYEHKVFVMAHIWGINPFDQWGVELGKIMAEDTLSELHSGEFTSQFDRSTNQLLNYVKKQVTSNE